MVGRWEYHIEEITLTDKWTAKSQKEALDRFRKRFETLGSRGWELVSYQSIPLTGAINTATVNGYAQVAIFKRPDSRPPDLVSRDGEEGWHPDPLARHELRFWNGSHWTRHVSDDGTTSEDPYD